MCKSKEFKNYQRFVKEAIKTNLDPKTREKYVYELLKDSYKENIYFQLMKANNQKFIKEMIETNFDLETRNKYINELLKDCYKRNDIFRLEVDSWFAKVEYVICGNGYNRNDKFYYRYGTLVQDNSSFEEGIDTIKNIFKKYSINKQMIEKARRVNYIPKGYLIPIKDPYGKRNLNEVEIDEESGDFIFWDDERKRRGDFAYELFLSEVKENTNK
jgi:hypothetical protein